MNGYTPEYVTYNGLKVYEQNITDNSSILLNLLNKIESSHYLINIETTKKHFTKSLIIK